MRKRGVYLMLVGLVVVGVLVVVFRHREREPEYGGKRLSEWVGEYAEVKLGHQGPREPLFPGPQEDRKKVHDAILEMGTNSIPYLVKWIRYEQATWRRAFDRRLHAALAVVGFDWSHSDRKEVHALGALGAFRTLGPDAGGAIKELAGMLGDPRQTRRAERAAIALGYIGKDGIPAVLALLTNGQAGLVRSRAVFSLAIMGTNAAPAVPALSRFLNDPDPHMRVVVKSALRAIQPDLQESTAR